MYAFISFLFNFHENKSFFGSRNPVICVHLALILNEPIYRESAVSCHNHNYLYHPYYNYPCVLPIASPQNILNRTLLPEFTLKSQVLFSIHLQIQKIK